MRGVYVLTELKESSGTGTSTQAYLSVEYGRIVGSWRGEGQTMSEGREPRREIGIE
jgi:hypothetical protein